MNLYNELVAGRKATGALALLSLCTLLASCGGNAGANVSALPAITRQARTTQTAVAPQHVQTADYWLSGSPSSYAPYLTYEYPASGGYAATHAAGIKTVAYENPFMPQKGEFDYALSTSKYPALSSRTCAGTTVTSYSGSGTFTDLKSSSVSTYLQGVFDHFATFAPDVVFLDNANDVYGIAPGPPCSYAGPADWTIALNDALARVNFRGAQVVLNTLSVPESYAQAPTGVTAQNQVSGLASVQMGEYEGCYTHSGDWVQTEQTEILTARAGKIFWCYANGAWSRHNADAWLPERLFTYASFLLSYAPDASIYQTWLQTASGFRVMPETGFVPTQPDYAITNVAQLQFSGGAYARGYQACYYRGTPLGPCRVVVNPGDTTAAVPYVSQFHHSMVLHGSDILDGGSVTLDGAVEHSLAPNTAEILIQ